MSAERKLDYFSRQQREGWTVYGNDTGKFKNYPATSFDYRHYQQYEVSWHIQ